MKAEEFFVAGNVRLGLNKRGRRLQKIQWRRDMKTAFSEGSKVKIVGDNPFSGKRGTISGTTKVRRRMMYRIVGLDFLFYKNELRPDLE